MPASGHSEATNGLGSRNAWRATGLPTLSAVSKFSFMTPHEPPWPEQRSMTLISVSGTRRSISADFWPMFWARA